MKETYYFSHDYNSRSDEKIKPLIRKHGMSGYGVFWAIIEDLYNNANAMRLDCESIAYDMRTDETVINSIINDFDLFVIKDGYFGSLSIERRINEKNAKSRTARKSAITRWEKYKADANALKIDANVSKSDAIKERKGKEIKEKKIEADFFTKIITAFQESYFDVFQIKYAIMAKGKENAAVSKLVQYYKKQYPEAKTEEVIEGLRKYFESCCQINEPWLQTKMSIPLIVSQFNQINNILKNGKSKTIKSVAARSSEIESIVDAVFSAKREN